MSLLRKLVDCDGTPRATLDKGELGMDEVPDDGEIPAEQRMHVQRLGRGVYLVRAVADGTIPAFRRVFGKTRRREVLDMTYGVPWRWIRHLRSVHFAVSCGRERCIKSGGSPSRSAWSCAVDGESIRTESNQLVEIDGFGTPVHTEGYE